MTRHLKRLIALILSVSMCLSLLCSGAWAAESELPQGDESTALVSAEGTETECKGDDAPGDASQEEEKPQQALSEQAIVSGTYGTNLTWTLDDNGTLKVSGTGKMAKDGYRSDGSWYNRRSYITKVMIQDGVTSIGDSAFSGCINLTSVTIGKKVTSIGDSAFSGCINLTNVTIGPSVTSIGHNAFSKCSKLPTLSIPAKVTSIGNAAFYECSKLVSVTIPASVTSIGDSAFFDCVSLSSITLPEKVTRIREYTFSGCKSLSKVTIGKKLTSIEKFAFCKCSTLPTLSIPASVTNIGDSAFYDCSNLSSISIPTKVTSIGNSVFYKCGRLHGITIPTSVSSIGEYAFYGCIGLSSITIPDSVTSMGDDAFYGCTALTSVKIGKNVRDIGANVFANCSSLTNVSIGKSVTSIGLSAFSNCTSLASIIIPTGVTSIMDYAFSGCVNLTSITIPSSVTEIRLRAFKNCNAYLIIKGAVGSTAQKYAADNQIQFESASSSTTAKMNNKITASDIKKTASSEKQSFSIGAKAQGGADLSYQCNDKTVVISGAGKLTLPKNYIGRFTVTIKAEETELYSSVSKSITVEVVPPKAVLKSVTSPKKKWIKVAWNTVPSVSGYQMEVSPSKGFQSGKENKVNVAAKEKSLSMSGLTSKKTYYARIRAYKKSGSATLYGAWSAVKSVKVK